MILILLKIHMIKTKVEIYLQIQAHVGLICISWTVEMLITFCYTYKTLQTILAQQTPDYMQTFFCSIGSRLAETNLAPGNVRNGLENETSSLTGEEGRIFWRGIFYQTLLKTGQSVRISIQVGRQMLLINSGKVHRNSRRRHRRRRRRRHFNTRQTKNNFELN